MYHTEDYHNSKGQGKIQASFRISRGLGIEIAQMDYSSPGIIETQRAQVRRVKKLDLFKGKLCTKKRRQARCQNRRT